MLEILGLSVTALIASVLTIMAAVRWQGGDYLCDDCRFNQPADCHKLERPKALVCYSYRRRI